MAKTFSLLRVLPLGILTALAAVSGSWAKDDGSQMDSPFRLNYLGYFKDGPKIALFLTPRKESLRWELDDASGAIAATGETLDYVQSDFASGDSFYRVDFSSVSRPGKAYHLLIEGQKSEPFDIDAVNPYGNLYAEALGYFKDHRHEAVDFNQFLNEWTTGSIQGAFWNDAGDPGFYPTNTAIAAWTLMNLNERFQGVNGSFKPDTTLYDEVDFGTRLMRELILPGQNLAVAKLHSQIEPYGPCAPYTKGTCVSKPETKATYAVARTLAQMARFHLQQGHRDLATVYQSEAREALSNALSTTPVCRDFSDFGGVGGIYPDNDNYALWREPRAFREPCHPDRNNIEDDEFAALVEVFLTADRLGEKDVAELRRKIVSHPRFGEISEFWWGAVTATGNVSLLTARPQGIDLTPIRRNLFHYADERMTFMNVGYPGVTKDARSDRWDSGDRDDVDNNWRWGSNRMILNDGILLALAAEEKASAGEAEAADLYAGYAVRVMDYILGTNAMALSMVTGFGENAIERTHDCCVPDSEPGKMALGPNDWTNADDPNMPKFGSLPGMKMMPTTGTGWSAREVAIDGNAPLVWLSWWASHRAAQILALAAAGR
ncbi:MAG: glycoside hydrolase family 9 protein [Acidobacteriota bacterium]